MLGTSRTVDRRRYAWRTGRPAVWSAWIAANAIGGALLLGQICVYVPPVYPSLGRWVAPSVLLATPVLALVPQWLVLRRLARRLRWWVPLTLGATVVALVASSIAALLLGAAVWWLALASQPPLWLWLMVLLFFMAGLDLGEVARRWPADSGRYTGEVR